MPHAQVSSPDSPCVGDIPSCSSIISPNPYDVLSDENPNSIHENVTNNETQPPVTENNEKKSDTDTSFDAKHDTVLDKFKGVTKKNPSS